VAELSIQQREGLAMATIMLRRGADASAVGAALGVAAPDRPGCAGDAALTLVATGPDTWLAIADPAPVDWIHALRERLDGVASVSDQSGGYAVLRIAGPDARRILQRGLPIDLHPSRFGPGSAAVTVSGHIGIVCWQTDSSSAFEVATFRSFSASFRRWLEWACQQGD
jgi:methylglutamate dehydrogenase subunit D